jgi:hypothetical protein
MILSQSFYRQQLEKNWIRCTLKVFPSSKMFWFCTYKETKQYVHHHYNIIKASIQFQDESHFKYVFSFSLYIGIETVNS